MYFPFFDPGPLACFQSLVFMNTAAGNMLHVSYLPTCENVFLGGMSPRAELCQVIVIFMLLSSMYKSYIWENSVFKHSVCLICL